MTQLCSQGPCIIDSVPEGLLQGFDVDCDRLRLSDPIETSFVSREPAPAASGVTQIAMVEMVAGPDSRIAYDASYLVAEYTEGWCLVDVVLGWNQRRGFVENDFQPRWEPHPNGLRLHLQSHRVLHEPLDQAAEEGTSDVSYEHCNRYVYELSAGRFTRISEQVAAGVCTGRGEPL
jgi:hypothetical protein